LNTDEADFYFKRGIVYGKTQDFRNCISDIKTCLSLDPAYYEAYYWRGVAMVNLNQNACADFKIAANHNYQPAVNAFKKYCQ
jgi:Tfp pilus assembly protein PilF